MKYVLALLLLTGCASSPPTFGQCVDTCWMTPRTSAWTPIPTLQECIDRCREHLPPRENK